jgi:hypothetical protein
VVYPLVAVSCGRHFVVSSEVPLNSSSKVHLHVPLGGAIGGADPAQFVDGCVVVVDDVVVVDEVVVVDVELVVDDDVVVVGHVRWSEVANANSSQSKLPDEVHLCSSAWKMLHLDDVLAASTAAEEEGATPGQVPTRLESPPTAPHVGTGRVTDASNPWPETARVGVGPGPESPTTTRIGNNTSSTAPNGAATSGHLLLRRTCLGAAAVRACFGPAVRACLGPATVLTFPFPPSVQRIGALVRVGETRFRSETCSKFGFVRRPRGDPCLRPDLRRENLS